METSLRDRLVGGVGGPTQVPKDSLTHTSQRFQEVERGRKKQHTFYPRGNKSFTNESEPGILVVKQFNRRSNKSRQGYYNTH